MPVRMLDNMMAQASGEKPRPLVDLGYVNCKSARDRADKLLKIVGKKNLSIGGFGRLLIAIPTRKLERVMADFPIKEGETYAGTTHNWLDKEAVKIEYAMR